MLPNRARRPKKPIGQRQHPNTLHFARANPLDRGIIGAAIDRALTNRDETRQGDVAIAEVADPAHGAARRLRERFQLVRRRDNFLEFARIFRADIGEDR